MICLSVLVAACSRPATQLVPVIDSDLPADDIQCVLVEAAEYTGGAFTPTMSPALFHVNRSGPRMVSLPFSMGIVPPASGHRARVEVRTHALRSCEDLTTQANRTVTRIVRTGFRQDQSLRLPIFLSASCADVVCGEGQSCEGSTCVAIPFTEPGTLRTANPGDELIDPDMDAGARMDAPTMDAPALDAASPFDTRIDVGPAIDATRTDAGPRPDAPLADAGSICPTVGTMVGSSSNPAAISAFGLTQSDDGTQGARSIVFTNGANAMRVAGGNLGGGYFNFGNSGPTSIALLDMPSTRGAFVFGHATRGLLLVTSSSDDLTLGAGACPTSRCIAEFNGNYVVLRGPSTLSLVEVSVVPALVGTATPVAMGTTAGAIRSIDVGALVTYTSGGMCTLKRWPDRMAAIATLTVPSCRQLDMAQLADGQIAITWIDTAFAVHVALTDASLSVLNAEAVIDGAQTAQQPAEVNATSTGFRVTWLDDLATPLLRSVGFDSMGTPLSTDCAATPTHVLANYRQFHAVRRGATSAVEWVQDNDFYGVTFTD